MTAMTPVTLLAIASVMTLYILVALCAMYSWQQHEWWLSIPLTAIFAVSTVALLWTFDRWGTP